jgi:hypothetical protein
MLSLTVSDVLIPRPEKRENSRKSLKIGQLLPILANFSQFSGRYSIWYFLILHALGYLKPVTVF